MTVNLLIAVLLKRSIAMLVKSDESFCRNTDVVRVTGTEHVIVTVNEVCQVG